MLGREAAFLIQNMFPVTEEYLIQYKDKNQQPIHIDGRIVTDVRRHASEVLAWGQRAFYERAEDLPGARNTA